MRCPSTQVAAYGAAQSGQRVQRGLGMAVFNFGEVNRRDFRRFRRSLLGELRRFPAPLEPGADEFVVNHPYHHFKFNMVILTG